MPGILDAYDIPPLSFPEEETCPECGKKIRTLERSCNCPKCKEPVPRGMISRWLKATEEYERTVRAQKGSAVFVVIPSGDGKWNVYRTPESLIFQSSTQACRKAEAMTKEEKRRVN